MADGVILSRETAKKVVELISKSSTGLLSSPDFRTATDPIIFRNDSNEEVPPFACMKVIDAEEDTSTGRYVIVIDKPDSNGGPFIFNGSREVEIDGYGVGHWGVVKIAFSGTAPTAGDTMGVSSDWKVLSGGVDPVVIAFGEIDTELIYAVVISGNLGILRFKLTADLYQCDESDAQLIDTECNLLEEIRIIDLCGYAELYFDEDAEPYAPENSMGHCQYLDTVDVVIPDPEDPEATITVQRRRFEVINIAVGCCDEIEPPCPQIPGVPESIIPEATGMPTWGIGFDEDGCLVKFPFRECPPCEEPP
jgi:hypothetical protein